MLVNDLRATGTAAAAVSASAVRRGVQRLHLGLVDADIVSGL
jgi:hypothetical protein